MTTSWSNRSSVSVSGGRRAVRPAHAGLHPGASHQEHEGSAAPSEREPSRLLWIQSGLHGHRGELHDPVPLYSSPWQQSEQRTGPRSRCFFDFAAPPRGEEDLQWWASCSGSRSPPSPPLPAVPPPDGGGRVGAGRAAQTHPWGQRVRNRRHQGPDLHILVLPVPRAVLVLLCRASP